MDVLGFGNQVAEIALGGNLGDATPLLRMAVDLPPDVDRSVVILADPVEQMQVRGAAFGPQLGAARESDGGIVEGAVQLL